MLFPLRIVQLSNTSKEILRTIDYEKLSNCDKAIAAQDFMNILNSKNDNHEKDLECTLTKTTIILAKLSLFIPDEPLITRIWNTVTGTIIYNKDTIKKLATTWYQYSPNNTMILLINDLAHDCELLLQLLKNYRLITIDDEINTSKIIQLINWCQSSSVTPFTRY